MGEGGGGGVVRGLPLAVILGCLVLCAGFYAWLVWG